MASAADDDGAPDDNQPARETPCTRRAGDVTPPFHPNIDASRYERAAGLKIRGVAPQYMEPGLESARRLWCRTASSSSAASTDRDAIRRIARYLAIEAERVGSFNYKAALRRGNVDAFIRAKQLQWSSRGTGQAQGQLYEVGRLVHPREYPARNTRPAPHVKRIEAASPNEVQNTYAVAATLPTAASQRLNTLLDLCVGAGARAADFKVLRGTDVSEANWEGDPVALVRLPNHAGGSRIVPVADPETSARIIALARARGPGYLMASATGAVERNAANRAAEHLRDRGHRSVSATALRNRWVLDMAATVPAALMLQLADVIDTQILADQRHLLPTYGVQHAIALTKESHPNDH